MSVTASAAAAAEVTLTPSQILHALMVSYLYPLFKNPHTGNVDPLMARDAAVEILKTFRIRDTWELFTCTQIMGFGLAALGSIGLSMTEGMSPAMVLRCRGNANGLHRASQQSRHMLDDYRAAAEAQRAQEAALAREPIPDLADAQAEAAAQIAEMERLLAAARARAQATAEAAARAQPQTPAAAAPANRAPASPAAAKPVPAEAAPANRTTANSSSPNPAAAAPTTPFCATYRAGALSSTATPAINAGLPPMPPMTPGMTELQHQHVWANAMLTVAHELTEELPHLSPEERRLHKIRISALTEVANNLLHGRKPTPLPPLAVPRTALQ